MSAINQPSYHVLPYKLSTMNFHQHWTSIFRDYTWNLRHDWLIWRGRVATKLPMNPHDRYHTVEMVNTIKRVYLEDIYM